MVSDASVLKLEMLMLLIRLQLTLLFLVTLLLIAVLGLPLVVANRVEKSFVDRYGEIDL